MPAEIRRRAFQARYAELYRIGADLAWQRDDLGAAWEIAEHGKLRTLLDLTGSPRPRLDTAEERAAYDALLEAERELYHAEQDGAGEETLATTGAPALQAARRQYREARDRLNALVDENRRLFRARACRRRATCADFVGSPYSCAR